MNPEMKKVFDQWWKNQLKRHEKDQFTLQRPRILVVIEDAFAEGWAGGMISTMETFGAKRQTRREESKCQDKLK